MGLIGGLFLAHVIGLGIKSSCIFFSGIGVLSGAILGKKLLITQNNLRMKFRKKYNNINYNLIEYFD